MLNLSSNKRKFPTQKNGPEVGGGSEPGLCDGRDRGLGVGEVVRSWLVEEHILPQPGERLVHVVHGDERQLHVTVDDPVHVEVIVVFTERVDHLLRHL